MEDRRFDGITRAFASGMSRRGGIAAMVAGVLGAAGVTAAAANPGRRHEKLACRNANSECTSDDQCCSGSCVPKPEGGTGFRCAKRHKRKKGNGGGKKDSGSVIPLGEPCNASTDTCADGGSCREYFELAQSNLGRFGTYCTSDTGSPCPPVEGEPPSTWMGTTCVGGFCAYQNGDQNVPGVCGEQLEVTTCLGNGACISDNFYGNYEMQVPATCVYVNNAYATIKDWSAGSACTQDSDCAENQFCMATSLVGDNPCNVAYFAGYCVLEGRYNCMGTYNCPERTGYTVASCAPWSGSTSNFCYYTSN